ncbi:hypothetical protein [Candidatus Harpocratesius sp.]
MPRKKNPNKYPYAKTLLETQLSIRQVQNELKRIFGSGMSPNQLLELRSQIINEREQNIKNNKLKQFLHPESQNSEDIRYFADQFNESMSKFTEQLKAQQIILTELSDKLNMVKIDKNKSTIQQNEITNLSNSIIIDNELENSLDLKTSPHEILFKLENWQAQLSDYLNEKYADKYQIQEFLDIPLEIVEILLNHLEVQGKIISHFKDGFKIYSLTKKESFLNEEVDHYYQFIITTLIEHLLDESKEFFPELTQNSKKIELTSKILIPVKAALKSAWEQWEKEFVSQLHFFQNNEEI